MRLTPRDRKNLQLLLLLGIGAGLAFGFWFYAQFPEKCDDVDGFGRLAAQFASDLTFGGSVRRAPIFPFLLGWIYRVFGPYNHAGLIAFHVLCLVLLGTGFYLFSKKVHGSEAVALVTGLLIILNPFVIWYVPRIWVELVFTLLVSIMVFTAYLSLRSHTLSAFMLFGLATGVSALCKAVTLLFPLFLGLALVVLRSRPNWPFSRFPKKKLAAFLLIPTAAAALTISPWAVRNRLVTGHWIPVSMNLGVEYFRGNYLARNKSYLISQQTLSETLQGSMAEEDRILQDLGKDPLLLSDLEKDDAFRALMWEDIRRGPQRLFLKVIKQIPAFWYKGNTWWSSLYFLGQSAVFLTMFGIALFRSRRRRELTTLIGLFLLYMNLLHASLVAIARYSLPLYPLMTLIIVAWWKDKGKQPKGADYGGSSEN